MSRSGGGDFPTTPRDIVDDWEQRRHGLLMALTDGRPL